MNNFLKSFFLLLLFSTLILAQGCRCYSKHRDRDARHHEDRERCQEREREEREEEDEHEEEEEDEDEDPRERRIHHLHEAAENLEAAGFEKQAREIRKKAEHLGANYEREHQGQDIQNQIRLEEHIKELYGHIRKLRQELEMVKKHLRNNQGQKPAPKKKPTKEKKKKKEKKPKKKK